MIGTNRKFAKTSLCQIFLGLRNQTLQKSVGKAMENWQRSCVRFGAHACLAHGHVEDMVFGRLKEGKSGILSDGASVPSECSEQDFLGPQRA